MKCRRGFTLIELMVVISMIGILIGLLLPAVQSSREAARRTQCQNNLFQIGLGLASYSLGHDRFPPGCVNASGPVADSPVGLQMGWIAQVLPYLEERAVYDHINFSHSAYAPSNSTARSVPLAVFVCPSAPEAMAADDVTGSHYAGCHDHRDVPIDSTNSGILFLNSQIQPEDIKDGSRYTLMVGEIRMREGNLGWMAGNRSTLRNTATPIRGLNPGQPPGSGFGSEHWSGANFLFADGAVRFLPETIDPAIWRAMGSRAGGELDRLAE